LELLQHITLDTAGIGGKLTHDYLSGKSELKKFYNYTPDIDGLKKSLKDRCETKVNRKLLYDELHQQYAGDVIPAAVKENIHLLLQENTYTITTGHQLNLFTGPLYFIYKIASIISLTKKLSNEIPGYHFLPVYWMNSEDHDFEEINHFYFKNQKFEWKKLDDKFGPVGRMELSNMEVLLKEIEEQCGPQLNVNTVFTDVLNIYKTSNTLSQAHRAIVNKLFGEFGVIILDQDSKAFKKAFSSHIHREIFKEDSILNVTSTNKELEVLGYKPQVFAREINVFYTGTGYRERIIKTNDGFSLADNSKKWTKDELDTELDKFPELFGPNVVTRPMYQEFLLPNLAYVGGPAEIAYWLQYKTNFESKKIFYPTLILRDCFLILPEKKWRKVNDLSIDLKQMFNRIDDIINLFVKEHLHSEVELDGFKNDLNKQYDILLQEVLKVDTSMDSMVKAAQQKSLNDIDKIIQKLNKALKTKHENQLNSIKALHSVIYPNNELQERLINVFDITTDTSNFINNILECSNSLDARLKVITTVH